MADPLRPHHKLALSLLRPGELVLNASHNVGALDMERPLTHEAQAAEDA